MLCLWGEFDRRTFACPRKCGDQSANRNAMMLCADEKMQGDVDEDNVSVMMSTLEVMEIDEKKVGDKVCGDFIEFIKVNGKTMKSLYDTGATRAALKKGLDKPE